MTAPVIGALAIGTAAALVWYLRPATDATTEQLANTAVRPGPTAPAAPAAASRPAVEPAAEEPAAPANPAPTPEPAPLPVAASPTPIADLIGSRERELPRHLADDERAFSTEPVDAAWASGAQADIFGKLAQIPGLRLVQVEVECRSTMCRLLMVQPDAGGGGPRFTELGDIAGFGQAGWVTAVRDPSGAMRQIAYLRREGVAPPAPH